MSNDVFVCRYCVDWRETRFFAQHQLPDTVRYLYPTREKGAFVPKPTPANDISNTCVMLVKEGRSPMSQIQGHQDCAAVRILFAAAGKDGTLHDSTDREFLASYGEALGAVKRHAAGMTHEEQLRVLEKICVLQDINNLFSFPQLQEKPGFQLRAYAHYSLTLKENERQPRNGADIPLMIFDPEKGAFTRARCGNDGIRLIDLIDLKTLRPQRPGRFEITRPIDLDAAARNEVRAALVAAM